MSEVNERQTWEFFNEGLKKAASAAHELTRLKKTKDWQMVANSLKLLRKQGIELSNLKSLTDIEVLQTVNVREKQLNAMNDNG